MNIDRPVVIDDAMPDIRALREAVLVQPIQAVALGEETFRGIRVLPGDLLDQLTRVFARLVPKLEITFAFARESPIGQREPNYIHSDAAMGDVTGILYLNPHPMPGDGTRFWEHVPTGCQRGEWNAEMRAKVKDLQQWVAWRHVDARFGRLLLFPSDYMHSRAIPENFGVGDTARLVIVVFFRAWPEEAAIDG